MSTLARAMRIIVKCINNSRNSVVKPHPLFTGFPAIGTEGSVGTLITRPLDLPQSQWNVALTPAELRRLSAIAVSGVTSTTASASNYIYRPLQPQGGGTVIPNTGIFERISNLTNLTPKHGITTISESDEGQDNGRLQNFLERSPRKRSVTVIPTYEVRLKGWCGLVLFMWFFCVFSIEDDCPHHTPST